MSRARPVRRALVIKMGDLAGFVLGLAAMRRIREAHPDAEITLLTSQPFEALAKACPYVDAVDAGGQPEGFQGWLGLAARLRAARFDRVYDLESSSQTRALHGLMFPAPSWSGAPAWRGRMHALERQATQLKQAGIWPDAPVQPGGAPPPDLSWAVTAASNRPVERAGKPYVLMFPGPAPGGPEQSWPVERFGDLARALQGAGYDTVIVGEPQEAPLAQAIQRRAPQSRDLTGRTDFARIAALSARAAVSVGNAVGALHLTAAVGAPTVVVAPKSHDLALAGPRGHVTIVQADVLAELPAEEVLRLACAVTPALRVANA